MSVVTIAKDCCAEVLRALPGPSEHAVAPFTAEVDSAGLELQAMDTPEHANTEAWQTLWRDAMAAHGPPPEQGGTSSGATNSLAATAQGGAVNGYHQQAGIGPQAGGSAQQSAAAAAAVAAAAEQAQQDENAALYAALHEATGVPAEVIQQLQVCPKRWPGALHFCVPR